MLARNPKTGKPLRIIQSDASLWRDQKTLIWNAQPGCRHLRGAVGSVAIQPDTQILLLGADREQLQEDLAWLKQKTAFARTLDVLIFSETLVQEIGVETLVSMRLSNLLCLEELPKLYPFVGAIWDGTVEDAKAMVSIVLRVARSGPVAPSEPRVTVASKLGISLLTEAPASPPLWFVTQYYVPEKRKRAAEIRRCLQKNLECDVIDRIVLLNERSYKEQEPLLEAKKIHEVILGKRLTYAAVIRWIQEEVPEGVIVAFANADIYLDEESFDALWNVNLEDRCLALLRWDEKEGGDPVLFGPRADSQDTWIVTSSSVKKRTWDWTTLSFPFGQGGCDNAFALEMFKQKFLVSNPALTLKTIHVHESGVRGYDPKDIVDKPAYLYIQPTGLHDLQPLFTAAKPAITLPQVTVDRPIRGPHTDAQAKTFATMMNRVLKAEAEPIFQSGSSNRWVGLPVGVERRENVFATRDGLLYTTNSMLIGPTKEAKERWASAELSTMAASVHSRKALVAPLSKEIIGSPTRYVLEYLSKILLLRKEEPAGEFWATRSPKVYETLKQFRWGAKELPVISYEENPQAWCDEAVVWPIVEFNQEWIRPDQVEALRSALKEPWFSAVPAGAVKRYVVCIDEGWIQEDLVTALEDVVGDGIIDVVWPSTALEILISKLRGASGLIATTASGQAGWAWVLPRGAAVWEIQSEMAPNASTLHLCGAAGLAHNLVITPKTPGKPSVAELAAMTERVVKSVLASKTVAAAEKGKPVIILPTGKQGFFAHAGDSFREMMRLWEKKEYVTVEESNAAAQVWLGGIGETLLYDRPNMDWLRAAPPAELSWKRALFGNPAPLAGEKAWTFWPRRPELVEALVAEGVPAKGSRVRNLVFYGRSENAVQKSRRTAADWSAAFGPADEFVHVEGDSKYPFTQEEYLRRLATSRFGLCLAGFGKKCHREIECMAMGTVPICAPEVDMENYAEPPIEGTHFFRASGPAEAKRLATETSAATWASMSASCQDWWRRNASAEGSWALTKRLAGLQ